MFTKDDFNGRVSADDDYREAVAEALTNAPGNVLRYVNVGGESVEPHDEQIEEFRLKRVVAVDDEDVDGVTSLEVDADVDIAVSFLFDREYAHEFGADPTFEVQMEEVNQQGEIEEAEFLYADPR